MQKSILFIHPFLPYPLESGGHQALFNGIKAVKDDYDITLAFMGDNSPAMKKNIEEFHEMMPNVVLRPLLRDTAYTRIPSKKEKIYIKLRGLYHHILKGIKQIMDVHSDDEFIVNAPKLTQYWESTIAPRDKEWIEHVYKVSREKHYDIVQVEMPWMIKDVFDLPEDVKKIHVHHELGFVRRDLEIKNCESKQYYEVCKKFTDFNEISQLNMYDAVVTLSSVDSDKLKTKGVNIPIYSSFATIDSSCKIKHCDGEGKKLTFIGLGNHSPNFVGITWFLENCWTKLKEQDKDYTLDIIGKWSEGVKFEYTQKYHDINFLGYVDDLDAAIRDSIMIVPITIGSGIRMKILEAASKGVPFVSTTVGAEGIPVTNGVDCFIADEPDNFVLDIIKLQDVDLRNKFIIAAKRMIEENYSLDALRKNRISIYEEVLDDKEKV